VLLHLSQVVIIQINMYINLFNESVNKFGRLDKDCWICEFNAECIIKPLILKATLFVDAISKAKWFLLSQKICLYCIIIIILEL